jgi:hypothetical protein
MFKFNNNLQGIPKVKKNSLKRQSKKHNQNQKDTYFGIIRQEILITMTDLLRALLQKADNIEENVVDMKYYKSIKRKC